jgi:hypothetical protein
MADAGDLGTSSTAILLVNKVVHQEATPVFYGANSFFFDNSGALQDSLAWIGQSKQYLRHVEIDGNHGRGIKYNASWTALDRSLSLLGPAKGLRALHFYHNGFCGSSSYDRVDIRELGGHCTPLLRSLQAACEARNVHLEVLNVVKIVLPPCHCKLCPEPKKRCRYFACREFSTHGLCRLRLIATPGGGQSGESCHSCKCLCEDADDNNKLFNETMKDEIMRQLGLETNHEDA